MSRNFQVFDALEFLAEVTQHIPNKGQHLILLAPDEMFVKMLDAAYTEQGAAPDPLFWLVFE